MKYTILFILFSAQVLSGQNSDINYYLPDINYNPAITKPEDFLRFKVGDLHATHDQVYYYMQKLDAESDRISIEEYGLSHEKRPLIALKITAPENQKRLESIRTEHLKISDPGDVSEKNLSKQPLVIYLGYSIHGNEASGGNAAMMVAYYLAAAQSKEVADLLENTVILLDPCYNPDGFQRFSTWVNMHKGENPGTYPASREFNEAWPGARTNHYWFDLNRDWLFLQQPESRGRVAFFQKWKPNVLTDHHEMGSNGTFFFQPGISSAVNPLIPELNQSLTARIATYHAKALDKKGILYYSGESFDDFYAGKGSTYTDLNGCIGILFEQASSRGHIQQTNNGLLSFPFTIRNHVISSLSTLSAATELKQELLVYQRDFYRNTLKESESFPIKAYAISCGEDQERLRQFALIAFNHGINLYRPKKDISTTFLKDQTLIIPVNQPQFKVIRSMFDTPLQFSDSVFYDISTWTMSLAFDLNILEIKSRDFETGDKISEIPPATGNIIGEKSIYGYVFDWEDYFAPKVLNKILESGLRVKVANNSFDLPNIGNTFERGSIFIPVQNQVMNEDAIFSVLNNIAAISGIDIYSLNSGQNEGGNYMGSPSLATLTKPSVLILVGDGISANDAGELWHLLDTRYDMTVNLMDLKNVNAANLNEFNVILMPDGNYNLMSDSSALKGWVEKGNTIIAFQNAVRWLENKGICKIAFKSVSSINKWSEEKTLPYNSYYSNTNSSTINGAVFENMMDLSHPLCYGYHDNNISLLQQGELLFELPQNQYAAPVITTANPLKSGYLPESLRNKIGNSASIIISKKGNGRVICFANNPAFRAIWFGANKLIANAIFFGNTINIQTAEK